MKGEFRSFRSAGIAGTIDRHRLERLEIAFEPDRIGIGQIVGRVRLLEHDLLGARHRNVKHTVHMAPSNPRRTRSGHLDDGLSDRIGRRDDLCVGLVVALLGDQINKLIRQIDIGVFERTRLDLAESTTSRHAEGRSTG